VVIDHPEEDRVAARGGEPRLLLRAENGGDVGETVLLDPLLDLLDLARVYFRGEDVPGVADLAGQALRPLSVPRADVRDSHPWLEAERGEEPLLFRRQRPRTRRVAENEKKDYDARRETARGIQPHELHSGAPPPILRPGHEHRDSGREALPLRTGP
jgi:hypothetical protein